MLRTSLYIFFSILPTFTCAKGFKIIDIGTLPGYEEAYAIDVNDQGIVTGSIPAVNGLPTTAFIWEQTFGIRVLRLARLDDETKPGLWDMNNVGGAVGGYRNDRNDKQTRIFVTDKKGKITFPLDDTWAASYFAWISKINDKGHVVGESLPYYIKTGDLYASPWFWSKESGLTRIIPESENDQYSAIGLNNSDQIVGTVNIDFCGSRSFLYDVPTNSLTYISRPIQGPNKCRIQSQAYAINDAGDVVGTSTRPGNPSKIDAYIWNADTRIRPLNRHDGPVEQVVPRSVNEAHQVVGNFMYSSSTDVIKAFYWDETIGFKSIEEVIDPADPLRDEVVFDNLVCMGIDFANCTPKINNRGEIVLGGYYKSEKHHPRRAFVLEPVQP